MHAFSLLLSLLLLIPRAHSQEGVPYSTLGSTYSQHFNGLPNTGTFTFTGKGPFFLSLPPVNGSNLTGWQIAQISGSQTSLSFGISTGSTTTSGVYSFGLSNQTNRSLGTLASGTGIYSFGLLLTNNTGVIINQFTLSFTAIQWRKGGSSNTNHWKFGFQTGHFTSILPNTPLQSAPALDLQSIHSTTGAATLNGTQLQNQSTVTATLSGFSWQPGQQLILRWDDADEAGSDDALAIDDLSFTGQQVWGPPVIQSPLISHILPNSASVSCGIDNQFSPTSVILEVDHSPLFTNPTHYHPLNESPIPAGEGFTTITQELKALTPGLTYHVRIKASNERGTSYSNTIAFTTPTLPPRILGIIPDTLHYRIGDTALFRLHCTPDTTAWTMQQGNINGIPIQSFRKHNDSTVQIGFVVKEGLKDITANDSLLIILSVIDAFGNSNEQNRLSLYPHPYLVDANRPRITSFALPASKTYAAGDTLQFTLQYSETVLLDTSNTKPYLQLTVGSRIKQAVLHQLSPTQHSYYYIIQPEELDNDGIRLHNTIFATNITDSLGNTAIQTLPNAGTYTDILVDAVSPVITAVITPAVKTYGCGDSLVFTVHFSKPVFMQEHIPAIGINHNSEELKATMTSGNGSQELHFTYIVTEGVNIKQGFSLRNSLLISHNDLTDAWGNKANLVLRNIGAVSNIRIDGTTPLFPNANHTIRGCENKTLFDLRTLLSITQAESGEQIQWQLVTPPLHGELLGLPFTKRLGNTDHQPAFITYHPHPNHHGTDSFAVAVSDGVNERINWFYISMEPSITHNKIASDTLLCAGIGKANVWGTVPQGGKGPYRYHWQTASIDNPSAFVAASGFDHAQHHTTSPFQQSTWLRRIVSTDGCTDTSNHVLIDVKSSGLWIGQNNGNWNIGSNWCGATIPNAQTDVWLLQDTVMLHNNGTCRHLQLAAGSCLHITGHLTTHGNIAGNGRILASNGTITTAGNTNNTFHPELLHDNTVGTFIVGRDTKIVGDSLLIRHSLSLQKGKLVTNHKLILAPHAVLGPNAFGTQWEGMIHALYPNNNIWPVLNFHPFQEDLRYTQHPLSTPSYTHNGEQEQLFLHKLADTAGQLRWSFATNQGYWPSMTARLSAAQIHQDYLFPAHKKAVAPEPGYLTGTPFTGPISLPLPPIMDTSFQIIGNPYLSPITLQCAEMSPGISPYHWRWVDELGERGIYLALPLSSRIPLRTMEGFIIKRTDTIQQEFMLQETCKTNQENQDGWISPLDNTFQVILGLYKEEHLLDIFTLSASDTARQGYDVQDADKLFNPGSNLFSVLYNTLALAHDTRPFQNNLLIPLGIILDDTGQYHIKVLHCDLPPGYPLELADRLQNKRMRLQPDSILTFHSGIDISFNRLGRFYLQTPPPPPKPEEALWVRLYPVPAMHNLQVQFRAQQAGNIHILIRDMHGRILQHHAKGYGDAGTYTIPVAELRTGKYVAEIHCGTVFSGYIFLKQ